MRTATSLLNGTPTLLLLMGPTLSAGCSSGTSHTSAGTAGADGGGFSGGTSVVDGGAGGSQDGPSAALDGDGGGGDDGANGSTDSGEAGSASGRPRVFMALHGSNALADDAGLDDQWTYVRQHLDGLWGNNANISAAEEASLWEKVATRTLITECDCVPTGTSSWPPVGAFSGAQAAHPDLVINREAISLYTGNAADWDGNSIATANAKFVTNPGVPSWQLYKSVFTGWQPQEFQTPLPAAADAAFHAAKGAFMECPGNGCDSATGFGMQMIEIMNAMHAQGAPFVWFASPGGGDQWPAQFKQTYQFIASKGLWQPRDVVMIINYGGAFQGVPETVNGLDAPTVTGMLYWALHQAPITTGIGR